MSRVMLACVLCGCCALAQAADITVKGFGSIVAGAIAEGEGYIADYPNVAIYGKHGSMENGPTDSSAFAQETRLGLQGSTMLDEQVQLTLQMMSRGANGYTPDVEWLYVTYYPSNDLDVQAGKMRMPVYMYSERMDVGFTYPWIRIPADAYSLDVVNYNGLRVNYLTGTENTRVRLSAYGGAYDTPDSELMSYLFDADIDRNYKDLHGAVADISHDWLNVRLSYARTRMVEESSVVWHGGDFNMEFIDAAMQMQFGDFTFTGEWNRDRPFYESYFTSLAWQQGSNTFYLMNSKFDLDESWEKHLSQSLGMRHDVSTNMALKFDVTHMDDDGRNPFTGAINPVIKKGDGDVIVVTAGFDFIF